MSVIVIVIHAMNMQLLNYLPLRLLISTKVQRKTCCWILFTCLFPWAGAWFS